MVEAEAAAADKDPLDYAHYRVLKRTDGMPWRLGAGSMGVTFKAVDRRLKTTVALKLIQPFRDLDPKAVQLFVREARAAARIHHPNVAPVLFLSDAPGRLFYAMEFVDGASLHDWLQRHGPLDAATALAFARQICAGLVAIHEQQIVHRDLKPGNIMVVEFPPGHPRHEGLRETGGRLLKIIDFGLARAFHEDLTASRMAPATTGFHGTVIYASPEQCREERHLDGRSDIYSFGCIFWEMLAGRPPLEGETHFEQLNLHLNAALPYERLGPQPACLIDTLDRCLAKDPGDRYPDTLALQRALEECSAEIARGTRLVHRRQRRWPKWGLALAGAAVLTAAGLVGLRAWRPAAPVPAPKSGPVLTAARRAEAVRLFERGYAVEFDFSKGTPDYLLAASLYEQALSVDPNYAEAAARLSLSQSQAYWQGSDRSPARLALARQAADRATALGPGLAITRLALGDVLYRSQNDYKRSLLEFERAAEIEPNNAEAWYFAALAARRLGRWDTAHRYFARSLELDPNSERNRSEFLNTLLDRRMWAEAEAATMMNGQPLPSFESERVLAQAHLLNSWEPIITHARTQSKQTEAGLVAYYQVRAGLWREVIETVKAAPEQTSADVPLRIELMLSLGLAHLALGEINEAARAFDGLVKQLEPALLVADPRDGENWIKIAIAQAALGRTDETVAAVDKALRLLTLDRDAVRGAATLGDCAMAYAILGDYERAYPLLEQSLAVPSEVTTLSLRLSPRWLWLRRDPKFAEWIARQK
ncbi:MAG: protein kinase [Verrucomicrobia bacterium]|nr:protein kinase [Verrucomicrobiota bacterium]